MVTHEEFLEVFADWAGRNEQTHHCTLARRGATVVGMAWLAVLPRVPSARALVRASGDVQSVYVVPHERNAGIGGRMLAAVLERAFTAGLERVTVHSTPGRSPLTPGRGSRRPTGCCRRATTGKRALFPERTNGPGTLGAIVRSGHSRVR
ncbi:GNAT family N-acetyltransferase [Cryobacterium sp. PAMC25264]|uniref:GNAT family N-acetyltransferase n=1 Tax=Cryobacterium sp. PAMC25264 TaxID=2861288 RepID=UPI002105B669|nr:GNAT family N-acetyltransferase [Cryobacterium sp. PAMC25264]